MIAEAPPAPSLAAPSAVARRRDVITAFVASRLLVLVTAMVAVHAFAFTRTPGAPRDKLLPGVSHPFGHGFLSGPLDAVFTPLLRWDALWYLQISRDGYQPLGLTAGNPGQRPAFFPLYPALVHLLGGWAGDAATVVVATVLPLVMFGIALAVVHRLTELELGADAARAAVFVVAFWPGPFFSAPYTESLFLALTAGAFLAARTERWWLAGLLGAAASATRNTGLLLVIPLALLYLYGPRRAGAEAPRAEGRSPLLPRFRLRADAAGLALVPLGFVLFCLFLQSDVGSWQAWRDAQEAFGRPEMTSPITTLHLALTGAWHGVRDGLGGLGGPNILDLAMLAVVTVATVGVARRLPVAYVAWVLVALAPVMVTPFRGEALRSLPRFASVLFPLAMWLGFALARRRLRWPALAAGAALLVATTAAFALWYPYV